MKKQTSPSQLQKAGYTGLKVTSMLKACLSVEMKQHLRLVQLDNLSKINNKHFKLGYISQQEMTLLWNIYWNFVLNDFRFEDKTKKLTKDIVSNKEVKPEHIGMTVLNSI